jgi:restriction system protein
VPPLILDYTSTVSSRNSDWEGAPFLVGRYPDPVVQRFVRSTNNGRCPHCEHEVRKSHITGYVASGRRRERERALSIRVHGCTWCGWWLDNVEHFDPKNDGRFTYEIGTLSVLTQFEAGKQDLPLPVLARELERRPNVLYDIHSKKFEQLVGAICSEFSRVKAHVVGRSGDRGIDVVLLDGERRVAIQVKRRLDETRSEGVREVREFLGAMVSEGFRRGILVTTADHFTPAALATRDRAVELNAVDEFELVDVRRFYEMFRAKGERLPWINRIASLKRKLAGRGLKYDSMD